MTKKLTREDINERLASRGITLLSEYENAHTKALFRCAVGHERLVKPCDVLHKSNYKCAVCSQRVSSKEEVNRQLADAKRTVRLIGEYKGALTKTLFRCECGHEWQSKPNLVLGSGNCPVCADRSWNSEFINATLQDQGRDIEMIGEYVNSIIPTTFKCSLNHRWNTSAGNILYKITSGCPTCANYGFKPSKPAYVYVIKYPTFIKYGIANNLEQRLEQHRRWGNYEVMHTRLYDTGTQAKTIEQQVKKKFGGSYVGIEIMGNGWTETLAPEQLNALLETVRES